VLRNNIKPGFVSGLFSINSVNAVNRVNVVSFINAANHSIIYLLDCYIEVSNVNIVCCEGEHRVKELLETLDCLQEKASKDKDIESY